LRRRAADDVFCADALRPAQARDRTTRDVRDQQRRDARVVVDHLALGGAGLGVEHLVEVGQAQAMTAHLDVGVTALTRLGHTAKVISGVYIVHIRRGK